ncbi:MAG: hypothetical protein ACRD3W_09555, partial [Terriglobales bacterium]
MLTRIVVLCAICAITLPFLFSCSGQSAMSGQLKRRWEIVAQFDQRMTSGQFELEQTGSDITGIGSDDLGRFQINGQLE